jgi:CheY-like chemotaxis protein
MKEYKTTNSGMKRILVAEDDKRIAIALTFRLEQAGYKVIAVPDGLRTYLSSFSEKPDLILMDIFMPIGTGLQVADELKSSGLDDIPVIFLTASKEPRLREAAAHLGAAGFFEKPYDAEVLLRAIAAVLKTRKTKHSANQSVSGN